MNMRKIAIGTRCAFDCFCLAERQEGEETEDRKESKGRQ